MTDNIVTFKPKPKSSEPTKETATPVISILVTDDGMIELVIYADEVGYDHTYIDYINSAMIEVMAVFHDASTEMLKEISHETPVPPQED